MTIHLFSIHAWYLLALRSNNFCILQSEILAALPRLIKLSPAIVKEVFNRLLGVGGHVGQDAALTPSELMVALHNMDPAVCDIKSVIKGMVFSGC